MYFIIINTKVFFTFEYVYTYEAIKKFFKRTQIIQAFIFCNLN